ncbi:hypothetical protein ACFYNL_26370 [Streptomyces sp. NPDC007808]|uniref:hypothetical protein n=1 Tax=Streptomyces sp. NPDC007808 TaxID=3364779 RepID=UPI0036B490EE
MAGPRTNIERSVPLGCSEAAAADGHGGGDRFVKVAIDGRQPTAVGVEEANHPYWQTQFAHTYGEPPAGSVAAAFLNFLTRHSGRDILREHGHGRCSGVRDSGECRPVRPARSAPVLR